MGTSVPLFIYKGEITMIEQTLKERGDNYGSFHTQANLTQTLNAIITNHYASTHTTSDGKPAALPNFMAEAMHMICHKIARIVNGNPLYADSWHDIAGYATLIVDILEEANKPKEQEPTQLNLTEEKEE
jgi:hypothetical protein